MTSPRNALVVAEHEFGEIRAITHELVTAGTDLGAHITVVVVDDEPTRLHESLTGHGADEIISVRAAADGYPGEVSHDVVAGLIDEHGYDLTLVPFTPNGISFAGAVAAQLRMGFASGVTGLAVRDGQLTAERPAFEGKVVNRVVFPDHQRVLMSVRKGAFAPRTVNAKKAKISERSFVAADPWVTRLEHRPAGGDVDIAAADFILSIGRGAGGKENLPLFERLAGAMGATLAGSRPLIDTGVLHPSLQVGTSGRSVHPKVYLALGISGAIQHVAGITESETIIAVNSDPAAPIFDIADYGAVADLFAIAAELEKLHEKEPSDHHSQQTAAAETRMP